MSENTFIQVSEQTLKIIDEKMPPEEELQDLAEFFKAVSYTHLQPTRPY